MESGVGGEQFPRRMNRAVQQFCPSCVFLRIRHWVSPLLFSSGFAARKKEANSLHSGLIANGLARRQGRRGEPFIGVKRKPLTEQARDRAQPLAEKEICGRAVLIAELNQRWCSEDFAWVLTCCTYPLVMPAVGDPLL
jgi:hypothetical protein